MKMQVLFDGMLNKSQWSLFCLGSVFADDGTHFCYNTTWLFNGSTLVWEELAPATQPPPSRWAAIGGLHNNADFFIYGGYASHSEEPAVPQVLNDLWAYNIANNTWRMIASPQPPMARAGASG